MLPLVSVLAAVAFALASASAGQGPPKPPGPPGGSPPGLDRALEVQEQNTDRLLDTPGIVGTGVGLNAAGKPVIRIYTERGDTAGVPQSLDGVGVERVTTGPIEIRAPTDRFPRPVPIGVSSGHLNTATGTLGVRVTDGTNVYALSNNHVFAANNSATIGDGIIQPGSVDGGSDPGDRIGTLHDFQTINFADGTTNTMDAAIALTTTGNVGTATPPDGYGSPNPITMPAYVGQPVQKYGRTTGHQLGTVVEINVAVDVCYVWFFSCFEDARFVDQVSITPEAFSAGGDSGSLIVSQDTKQPVALLFAGGEGRTIGNPIDPVLQRFGVTIDGSVPPNGPPGAPTGLTALAGDASVALSWQEPTFTGGSPLTGYNIYRRTSPGNEALLTSVAPGSMSHVDSTATNGTTYTYRVKAVNVAGESVFSNEASATPIALVPPVEPLPILDSFNRANENPLSDAGRWGNGVAGSGESGLQVVSNELGCTKSSTCTAWRSNAQYGPDTEVWTTVSVLPGTDNQVRLYARLQQTGTAGFDGYMLRTHQLSGTDQVWLERVDNGAFVRILTVAKELAAGDVLLLRVEGSTVEAWHRRGSWTRLGTVTDSVYSLSGAVGVGLRGTSGRADDFGARTMGEPPPPLEAPSAPTSLVAQGLNGLVRLTWNPPASNGGSEISAYDIYRSETSGGQTTPYATIGVVTSYDDVGVTNGTTYYYTVKAKNAIGESVASNEATATPTDVVPPVEPRPTLDSFNRANENPLSDAGRWGNGVAGSGERCLKVVSNQLASNKTSTCTAWRSNAQYGPDTEVWTTVSVLPGTDNQVRLYARLQQTGTAGFDGYMLRTHQLSGTDQVWLERVDNGAFVRILTVAKELAAGDVLLLRVTGSKLEAWHRRGGVWTRLGTVTDSTYAGAGQVGVGLRNKTGRLDDFGARTVP